MGLFDRIKQKGNTLYSEDSQGNSIMLPVYIEPSKKQNNKLGWRNKEKQIIHFTDMDDQYLMRVMLSINRKLREYKQIIIDSKRNLTNINKEIDTIEQRKKELLSEKRILLEVIEEKESFTTTQNKLKAEAIEAINLRGTTLEQLIEKQHESI